jgi:thiosulfate/3-mercaptopyruvate sulfurtransferase
MAVNPLITAEELAAVLGHERLRVLDCSVASVILPDLGFELRSGRAAWLEGRIPGSQHVDLLTELSDQDAAQRVMMPPVHQICEVLTARGVANGDQIVLYDRDRNMFAARVWWMLRAAGIPAARVLDGGWQTWTIESRPVESGPAPGPTRASLTPTSPTRAFVGREEVLESLGSSTCVIDALQAETFRGERRDYGRPGHIPGAHNVPFTRLVDPDTHRYLPLDQLRDLFAIAGALDAPQVITYCGAGVAASSAALVLTMLGAADVAVYDGSMLEWANDPELPLVCGDR